MIGVTFTNPNRTGSIRVLTHTKGRGDMLGRAVDSFKLSPGETREHRIHPDQTVVLQYAA